MLILRFLQNTMVFLHKYIKILTSVRPSAAVSRSLQICCDLGLRSIHSRLELGYDTFRVRCAKYCSSSNDDIASC